MVGPFNQAVVNGKVGDIVKVETVFGFHVVKITGRLDPVKKVRVAVIDRAIEPSTKTFQDIYTQASSFAGENNSLEKFNKAVEEKGLNKRQATYLRDMTNSIPGIEMPREIVRWTYYDGIKFGEVSPVFDVGGAYVVACLTSIREKGTIPLSQIKENLRSFVLNDKKAEYIQNKIGNSSGDLFQIARDFNAKVDTNLNLTFASRNIPGFGSEYQVIGQIFSMKSGEQSSPIKGNGAVFVVIVDRIIEPAENMSFDAYKAQLMSGFKSRVSSNTVFTALQDKTKIEDNRRLYF
jgi:peptidyl-prolyl cis-trans isomerase D